MNADISVHKINESFMYVECEPSISKELEEYFSFYAENYRYHPKFKAKIWNGKIFLYNFRNKSINVGLLGHFPDFCKERKYSLQIDEKLLLTQEFSIHEAKEFIKTLNLPFEVRDYQVESFVKVIRNKRRIVISSTGSGKSLVLYLIVRYLQKYKKKGLLIVPTVSLTQQMFNDFKEYGYDAERYCHIIYSGKDKIADKFLYISTWQSLINIKKGNTLDAQYFEQFDFLINDECLHPETKITMGNGELKEIQNIQIGDIVKSFNEQTGCVENKPVVDVYKNLSSNEKLFELELDNGETIKITGNHKVLLTTGVWKRVDELKEGDFINSFT